MGPSVLGNLTLPQKNPTPHKPDRGCHGGAFTGPTFNRGNAAVSAALPGSCRASPWAIDKGIDYILHIMYYVICITYYILHIIYHVSHIISGVLCIVLKTKFEDIMEWQSSLSWRLGGIL